MSSPRFPLILILLPLLLLPVLLLSPYGFLSTSLHVSTCHLHDWGQNGTSLS